MQLIPYIASRFFLNTLFVTSFGMVAEIVSCALVAYGFARFRFPGRDAIFLLLLSTMMLPWVVTLIPNFLIWRDLKLINTYDPLVLRALTAWGPVNIFLIRQFMMTIPIEMEEAARIDGANTFQIFTQIMLPLVRPALLAVAVLTFKAYWNNFLGPLIYLNDMSKYTLTLGMFLFSKTPYYFADFFYRRNSQLTIQWQTQDFIDYFFRHRQISRVGRGKMSVTGIIAA